MGIEYLILVTNINKIDDSIMTYFKENDIVYEDITENNLEQIGNINNDDLCKLKKVERNNQ